MWVRTQNGEEILKVERFRFLPLDNGDVNILAKLPRDTVILGTYSKDQAEAIRYEIWMTNDVTEFAMPERWEEEE